MFSNDLCIYKKEKIVCGEVRVFSDKLDCEQPLFSFRLVRGVHARASVGRRSRETREARAAAREEKRVSFVVPLPSHAFSHARGHLRVSGVLLDGPRKKRGCSYSTDKCLKNNIIPSFCHNFDRFKSNIRTSYVTLCLFLLHTRVSTSSNP